METKINQIITALFELEAKECHRAYFDYGNGLFRVRIIHTDTEKVVYEKFINNVSEDQKELSEILNHVIDMRYYVHNVCFQCYRREFVIGVKSGEWEKIKPAFVFGKKATQSMQIDGLGYFVDDPENSVQYYVDMKQESETN